MGEEFLQAKENLMKSIQTFLKKFSCISFRDMPKVLLQAWEKFFEIQHAQPEDTNELLHKLLEDLKIISEELAEYINSLSWNRPTFYNDNEEHSIQYKEYLENSSNAIAPVLPTKEPDNSLKLNTKITDMIVESFSPSSIPVEDSDSQMEEIDLFLDTDDLMPPGIESDDYDLEGDIHFLEELLNTLPLPENESSNFDPHDDPSFPRPPPEPPDVEIFFDLEPIRIQQYLQNEHYALWEVIEFGDSYEAPQEESGTGSASKSSAKKKGRTVVVTTKDIQKRMNDVKARTTLLLALPDEHQLRFIKYKTAQELWGAILKIFGGNEATKKTKKNQLKQQYRNFKAEGSETLEQTFNRLQAIRNRGDLDTMSLDDLYNHLKVYEPKVQKKSKSNSQNMAFISSAKNSSGKGEVNTASITTTGTHKKTGKKITIQGTDVAGYNKLKVECFNYHKMGHFARKCRGPRSQDRGKRENQKQGSKIEESAPKALMAIDGVGWDWSYIANEEENHALVADEEAPTKFTLMAKSSSSSKNEIKKEKEGLDSKLTGFEYASKDLDTLLGSQRSDKNKEGLVYSVVLPFLLKSTLLPRKICLGQDCLNLLMIPLLTIEIREKLLRPQLVGFGDLNKILLTKGNSQNIIDDKGYWDSGCFRHMTGNISYLSDYEPYDGGYVSFRQGGGKITAGIGAKAPGEVGRVLRHCSDEL
nr:hypothetical protein [Tanacetum cinerariifolium]